MLSDGFSTAAQNTEDAGKGVGMGLIRQSIQKWVVNLISILLMSNTRALPFVSHRNSLKKGVDLCIN